MSRRIRMVLGVLSIALAGCSGSPGAHRHAGSGAAPAPMILDGLGSHHQSVTTGSPQAQAYFDQGLRLVYAFNHIEAESRVPRGDAPRSERARCATGASRSRTGRTTTARPTPSGRRRRYAAIQEALRWRTG